jgi:tetratricopeptide (TPR) repeat protein
MRLIVGLLLSAMLGLLGCADQELDIKRIPLTTNSAQAEVLMRKLMLNEEEFLWDNNESLLSEILELDPEFAFAGMFEPMYQVKDPATAKENFLSAYTRRTEVSAIERGIMDSMYAGFIDGDDIERSRILDQLVAENPEYYKLRIMSANAYNALENPALVEQRLIEAEEINPNSFFSYVRRAMLHFPVGENFVNLAVEDRDLEKAKQLLEAAQEILPNSPMPKRFLGNIYRNMGELDAALDAYKETVELIEDKESRFFSEAQLMVGHALTFKGEYDSARTAYQRGFEASPDLWWKFQVGMYEAQSYLFERKYGETVVKLAEHKKLSQEFGDSDEIKLRFARRVEEAMFRALSHSLDEDGSSRALEEVAQLSDQISQIEISRAESPEEVLRINRDKDLRISALNIWYDILFAKFAHAREQLESFESMSRAGLESNPNALVPYYKFQAQLNLMEGDPAKAIEVYSKVPKTLLDDDVYHTYFYALAKKAVGDLDESKSILEYISGYYFYDWGSALVRNLVEDQLASW